MKIGIDKICLTVAIILFLLKFLGVPASGSELDWVISNPRTVGQVRSDAHVTYGNKSYSDSKKKPKDKVYEVWRSPGPHSLSVPAYKEIFGNEAYANSGLLSYAGANRDSFLFSASITGIGVVVVRKELIFADATATGHSVVANTGIFKPTNYGNVKSYVTEAELKFIATCGGDCTKKKCNYIRVLFGRVGGPISKLKATYDPDKYRWDIRGNIYKYVNNKHKNEVVLDFVTGWTGLNDYKKLHSHKADITDSCRYTIVVNSTKAPYLVNRNNYVRGGGSDMLITLGCEIRKTKVEVD